jgi:hypothetical protein
MVNLYLYLSLVLQPVARSLPTHRTTQTQNKRTQTSMPQVGFEPTIPVFERAKTVHVLDRADLYLYYSICLHGVVLNYLIKYRITLPFCSLRHLRYFFMYSRSSSSKNCPGRCLSAGNVVCRNVGIFETKLLLIAGFLDFVHRPVFWKLENTTFRKLDLFPSSQVK